MSMVKDRYGNYVIQKMIDVASPESKDIIIKKILSSPSLKKREGFSKHVMNFIEKISNGNLSEIKTGENYMGRRGDFSH